MCRRSGDCKLELQMVGAGCNIKELIVLRMPRTASE